MSSKQLICIVLNMIACGEGGAPMRLFGPSRLGCGKTLRGGGLGGGGGGFL
jgi:hypothetical protein